MSAEPTERAPETTPADVAAWLRARTQDSEGREVGLWTEDTRPSVGQVDVAIKQARAIVASTNGWDVIDACSYTYETLVALEAACIIEKSYFPEQVVSGRSPYEQLREEADRIGENLTSCIVNGGLGPAEGGGSKGAYSVCTPVDHCGGPYLFAPDNWNNPYADDIDDPYEMQNAAVQWLIDHQDVWAGYPIVWDPVAREFRLADGT